MIYKKFDEKYLLRFELDDDFQKEFERFVTETNIELGNFEGIGSFKNCELGYYDISTKEFQRKVVSENHEVVSLLGTLSESEGKPYFHTHVTLGDKNFNTKAGHLYKGAVGATLEVVFEKISGSIERKFSDEIGLNLLEL